MVWGWRNIPRTVFSLLLAGVVAAVAIVVFTANEVRLDRQQRLADAERNLDAIGLTLAAQIERDMQSARLVMGYARNIAANYDLAKPGVGVEVYPALNNLAAGLPLLSNLILINADGVLVASSLLAEQPPIQVADRAYFRFHSEESATSMRVGENNVSRTLGLRVVQLTMRINRANGDFGGIVLAALRHDYFANMFRSFVAAEGGSATLLRRDGRLLARYPVPEDAAFEQSFSSMPVFAALAEAPSGSYRGDFSLAGSEARLFAYRTVGELPLVIEVSLRQEAVLAPWREALWRQVGVASLALASMAALIAVILRQVWRQEAQTRALAASEARFRSLFDSAADAIFLLRPDGRVIAANAQASATLDLPQSAIEGRPFGDFLVDPPPDRLLHALEMLRSAHPQGLEGILQGNNRVSLPVEVRFSRVGWGGESLYLGLARDISERKAYQAQLERLASIDELTLVPKRNLFFDRLEQALAMARRKERQVGVLFVDFDRFKEINDTLGHAFGDMLLQRATGRMLDCLRQVDTVGRYGGDEFVVLLPEITQEEDIGTVAGKLCDVFQKPFDLDGHEAVVNVSIGIAVFPRDGETAEALVRHADEAMYAAKLAGRNRVRQYAGG